MLRGAFAASALVIALALAACGSRSIEKHAAQNAVTLSPEYLAAFRATQQQLVNEDRVTQAHRRAAIARVVTGSARDVTPPDSMVERFVVTLTNRGTRTIRGVDAGVFVYDGTATRRLGMSTFSAPVDLPPGRTTHVAVGIPLPAFAAEGAGALARASGKPKHVDIDLTGYRLEGGGGKDDVD